MEGRDLPDAPRGCLRFESLVRKLHDAFFRQAKREGHLARSYYKLEELDRRNRLFHPGDTVLDLGAAPGSWLEYILSKVGPTGHVYAVDIQTIAKRFRGKVVFFKKDIRLVTPDDFATAGKFHVVVSDMAPSTTGIKITDQARSLELSEAGFRLACEILRPGGAFVCKVFEGPDVHRFREEVRQRFEIVKTQKPQASRQESMELYIVALGFKPTERASHE